MAVFAQSAALDAISENENNQKKAAEQARANQKAAALREEAANFIVVAPGVVQDKRTGLEWMRCNIGQEWDIRANTCANSKRTSNEYGWQKAQDIAQKLNEVGGYAGRTDWRVPSISELQSLVFCLNGSKNIDSKDGKGTVITECLNIVRPSIAPTIFPATLGETWSSTLYDGDVKGFFEPNTRAWYVNLDTGGTFTAVRGFGYAVRLVRSNK